MVRVTYEPPAATPTNRGSSLSRVSAPRRNPAWGSGRSVTRDLPSLGAKLPQECVGVEVHPFRLELARGIEFVHGTDGDRERPSRWGEALPRAGVAAAQP